jgi:hypothetical protein
MALSLRGGESASDGAVVPSWWERNQWRCCFVVVRAQALALARGRGPSASNVAVILLWSERKRWRCRFVVV